MKKYSRALVSVATVLATSVATLAATGWNDTPPEMRNGMSHLIPDPPPVKTHTMLLTNQEDGHEFRAFVAVPAGIEAPESLSGIILIHGSGTWERHSRRWMPMARELARLGYVAVYPDIRYQDVEKGPSDCSAVSRWLDNHGVGAVGIVGGSAGNNPTLSAVQIHAGEFDAYVDLYGGLGIATWGHLDEDRIHGMEAPVLMQVGANDSRALDNAQLLSWRIDALVPDHPQHLRVYGGEGHGFFFRDSPGAVEAQHNLVAFFDWALRGAVKPDWYVW